MKRTLVSMVLVLGACATGMTRATGPGTVEPTAATASASAGAVTYVPTRTIGVMFVVVHPQMPPDSVGPPQPGGGNAGASSDYILLCDGRGPDGQLHCDVATEAALARYSFAPAATSGAPPLPAEAVGSSAPATEPSPPPQAPPPAAAAGVM